MYICLLLLFYGNQGHLRKPIMFCPVSSYCSSSGCKLNLGVHIYYSTVTSWPKPGWQHDITFQLVSEISIPDFFYIHISWSLFQKSHGCDARNNFFLLTIRAKSCTWSGRKLFKLPLCQYFLVLVWTFFCLLNGMRFSFTVTLEHLRKKNFNIINIQAFLQHPPSLKWLICQVYVV